MNIKSIFIALLVWAGLATSAANAATDVTHGITGVGGYDLVSYHINKQPLRGNGYNVSVHDGVSYLFATKENKETFDANPDKYLPAYGGYCAYGVAVGKKFYSDPEVWRVVDGRLYLNLDTDIQKKWVKDIPGYIKTADKNWSNIKDKAPSEL